MAYDLLKTSNPGALDKANTMLQAFAQANPDLTSSEGSYPFVECATFADEIKSKGYDW